MLDKQQGNKIGDIKESQIKDKLHDKFIGPFQILQIHNNSVIYQDLKTNQRT